MRVAIGILILSLCFLTAQGSEAVERINAESQFKELPESVAILKVYFQLCVGDPDVIQCMDANEYKCERNLSNSMSCVKKQAVEYQYISRNAPKVYYIRFDKPIRN